MATKTESKGAKLQSAKLVKAKSANMLDKEQENTKNLIEMGADIAGNAAGAAIGFMFAGPTGSVIGAAATPVLTSILKTMGSEIKSRLYSDRELIRAGGAMAFAIQKIQSNIKEGKALRSDGFFESTNHDRGAAKELLEGILLAAQKEYQEKKVKFYGNLYANIAFESDIDRFQANYLIRLLDRLSFRQLCLIAEFRAAYFDTSIPNPDVMNELNELVPLGIIEMKQMSSKDFAEYQFKPYARKLYELFGLNEIDEDERKVLFRNPQPTDTTQQP